MGTAGESIGTGAAGTTAAAAVVAAGVPVPELPTAVCAAATFSSLLNQAGRRLNAPAVLTSTPPAIKAAVTGLIVMSLFLIGLRGTFRMPIKIGTAD